ncbi:MAG: nitrilase-related carbon-nitrogen hydrolase, partial [Hydrogenophaga sp.]|nr:nitrilase-related carbon-nitrogen hydrolase [Hydrogenophaga sp.]
VGGQRLAPNICYEDLFGEELAASFRDPDQAPTVLVNLSNIAWFGDTVAIDQHLHISRLRALELGRPMLRATNTGATAVIDHRGVVTHLLPRLTRDRLEATVQGRSGTTPYARWAARWGLWPLWGVCLAMLLLIAATRRRGARLKRG